MTDEVMHVPNRHVPITFPKPTRPPHVNRFEEVHRQLEAANAEQPKLSRRGRPWALGDHADCRPELLDAAREMRAARVQLGLSQTQLAAKVGCSNGLIGHMETARCGKGKYEQAICKLLNIQPQE